MWDTSYLLLLGLNPSLRGIAILVSPLVDGPTTYTSSPSGVDNGESVSEEAEESLILLPATISRLLFSLCGFAFGMRLHHGIGTLLPWSLITRPFPKYLYSTSTHTSKGAIC